MTLALFLYICRQILTPTVTLLCATVLLCMVGLLAGGPQDSEDKLVCVCVCVVMCVSRCKYIYCVCI